ncbi:MAG: hypothetical protein WBB32_14110 [Flavobacteriales bacterium]|nr:hypothetical protein [Flavobacteriales bacterium]
MTDIFFAIGHFFEWILEILVIAKWTIPAVITVILVFGMAFWLWTQTVLTRKAKERDEFI